jgi:pimeloyl-ACP methyl ester carboxylesterase
MQHLQDDGIYPAAFSAITVPVLMVHGDADPHPGRMVEASLRPFITHLEYRELARCGHYPWLELHAREPFFEALRSWLARGLPGPAGLIR